MKNSGYEWLKTAAAVEMIRATTNPLGTAFVTAACMLHQVVRLRPLCGALHGSGRHW